MADNVIANTSDGLGSTFATDDIGGIHYPISKLAYGALDTAVLVSTSNGLPAQQQGTWNITNISGTVSLPTGAATAAKQPAIGTAGTASADVITVQGIAAMTPLLATLSGTNNIATVTTVSTVTSLTQMNGAAISMGTGTRDSGTQRVTIATNDVVPASQSGTWTVQPGNTANTTPWLVSAGHGKTPKFVTGSASATFTIVAAVGGKKIKVYSLSLMTSSTTAVTITFKSGAAGTAIATYPLQAITGTVQGITENNPIPSHLFETAAGSLLEMSFSAAQTVTYNLRYFDDDAS